MKKLLVFLFALLILSAACQMPWLDDTIDDPSDGQNSEIDTGDENDVSDEDYDNPEYHIMAAEDTAYVWTIAEPASPAPLSGEYRHLRYDFSPPEDDPGIYEWMPWPPAAIAMSGNGARTAVAVKYYAGTLFNTQGSLYLFSPEDSEPIWVNTDAYATNIDMTACGRGLLTFGTVLRFFETDNPEPVWEWDAKEYEREDENDQVSLTTLV